MSDSDAESGSILVTIRRLPIGMESWTRYLGILSRRWVFQSAGVRDRLIVVRRQEVSFFRVPWLLIPTSVLIDFRQLSRISQITPVSSESGEPSANHFKTLTKSYFQGKTEWIVISTRSVPGRILNSGL